jgi:SAM-dependent methyltransferase
VSAAGEGAPGADTAFVGGAAADGLGAVPVPGVDYWRRRALALGDRAVVNLDHPADGDLDAVSDGHREQLFPLLRAELTGAERTVLDLGCGTGRLTAGLAALLGGRAIGVDPVAELLALAPPHADVEYRRMDEAVLPVGDGEVDVVFTSLVLGGIPVPALGRTAAEIRRVLAPGGLVFLSESVSDGTGAAHWATRSADDYRALLPWAGLRETGGFDDAGDAIAVLVGRAPAPVTADR